MLEQIKENISARTDRPFGLLPMRIHQIPPSMSCILNQIIIYWDAGFTSEDASNYLRYTNLIISLNGHSTTLVLADQNTLPAQINLIDPLVILRPPFMHPGDEVQLTLSDTSNPYLKFIGVGLKIYSIDPIHPHRSIENHRALDL